MPSHPTPGPDLQRVATLAELARIELAPDEAGPLAEQLDEVLGYLRSLQTVDVDGVPEYLSAERPGSGTRPDTVVEHGFDRACALAGVPVLRGPLVAVPKFVGTPTRAGQFEG